jgi:hypothetical protein
MLVAGIALLAVAEAQLPANTVGNTPTLAAAAVSTARPQYTKFDLFKNSGFTPCAVNGNTTADPSTKGFIGSRDVGSQAEFCSFQAGIPIMIPTAPTQIAFFPWWPTLLAQTISLSASYSGLYFTLRTIDRQRMLSGRKVPVWFWVQLPIDVVRMGAWLFKTIHGFADDSRFAWVSMLLWLLPLNYVFLASQMQREAPYNYDEPYVGADQQLRQLRELDFGDVGMRDKYGSNFGLGTRSSAGGNLRTRSARGARVLIWAVLAGVMWFLSFVVMILHWKWKFSKGSSFERTYNENTSALVDPRSIGTLPAACLSDLSSGALARSDLFVQNKDELIFALIATFQFLLSSAVLAAVFLGRKEPFDRAYRVLYISAGVTLFMLLIPALALGVDIIANVLRRREVIAMRFTNDLRTTGGCTFSFVNMDKRLGYWDVADERAFRIVMALLGAS